MHILSMKGKTKKKSIQPIEDAPFLYIPLLLLLSMLAIRSRNTN